MGDDQSDAFRQVDRRAAANRDYAISTRPDVGRRGGNNSIFSRVWRHVQKLQRAVGQKFADTIDDPLRR